MSARMSGKPRYFSKEEVAAFVNPEPEPDLKPPTVPQPPPPKVSGILVGDLYKHYAERDCYRLVTSVSTDSVRMVPCSLGEAKTPHAWEKLHVNSVSVSRADWQAQLGKGKWILIGNVAAKWES